MDNPILQFKRLFEPDCGENEAYQILCSLEPSLLSLTQLKEIVEWVEKSAIVLTCYPVM